MPKVEDETDESFISSIDRYIHCYLQIKNSKEKLNHIIRTNFRTCLYLLGTDPIYTLDI